MPPTSPALGSNLASRAMPLNPLGYMAPSDAVDNTAVFKPTTAETAPTVEVATATTANAVVERWADMAPDQGEGANAY